MQKEPDTSQARPRNVDELLAIQNVPVISIDQASLITYINEAFQSAYGWTTEDLLMQPVGVIMPEHLRDAHKIGFSRFLTSEKPTLLGTPLPLEVLLKDGSVHKAEHFIIGDKTHGEWRFAATITRVP